MKVWKFDGIEYLTEDSLLNAINYALSDSCRHDAFDEFGECRVCAKTWQNTDYRKPFDWNLARIAEDAPIELEFKYGDSEFLDEDS